LVNAKSYFDMHAHQHAYHKDPDYYITLVEHIKKNNPSEKPRILDVGCGEGSFIRSMILSGIKADYVGSDISSTMIGIARKNLTSERVELLLADAFTLPIRNGIKFDLIHIDSVLHHLIGKTRSKSSKLVNQILDLLSDILTENGVLVVEEIYYASYIVPEITSFFIFYGLKMINALQLDFGRLTDKFHTGLEVNFLHDKELERILKAYGEDVHLVKKDSARVPMLYRLLFLKEFGHISYIVTAHGTESL
jgi:SAM-dependent methyltransferase